MGNLQAKGIGRSQGFATAGREEDRGMALTIAFAIVMHGIMPR